MNPDFQKGDGLIPAIVQDARGGQVLMLGYMNESAFNLTRQTGLVTFWSRSKQRLWVKGETSGNTLRVQKIRLDCDEDTLLIQALPKGPVCHTGSSTCFGDAQAFSFLHQLESIVADRRANPADGSYTASLFASGINRMAQKVGEEAVELVIEAKDDNREKFIGESADLLFHLLVLLKAKGVSLEAVEDELRKRHNARMRMPA